MRPLLFAILSTACAVNQTEPKALDSQPLSEAIAFSDPNPLVNLEETLRSFSGVQCPTVERIEGVETWNGGCETEAGLQIDGQLKMVSGQWIASEGYVVRENEQILMAFDGGLEKHIVGELLQIDFTGELCGVHADDCAKGTVQLEITATIYPISDYPGEHDVTVNGFVHGESSIGFDGSWSRDVNDCSIEATDGVFGVWKDDRHDLVLNGAENCDSCAEWRVQGSTTAEFCGNLP